MVLVSIDRAREHSADVLRPPSLAASAGQAQTQTQAPADPRPANNPAQQPAFAGQTDAPEQKLGVAFDVVTVAEGLQNPWGMAFLPDGKMLVTERPGRLRVVGADGKLSEPVAGLPAVDARGQGGLLDVALDPAFAKNNLIYWSYSEPRENNENNTAVARGKFVDDAAAPRVEDVQVIYHQTPSLASTLHFGSRLVFGRDGTLFVTQGDRSITPGRMQAQKMDSGIGKLVRINADGSIPKDNPFVGKDGVRPEIWSIGHRNIQAAALHPTTGELWEVEHGTRGGDEINIARKGKDYGWPTIAYGIEYQGGPITGGITAAGRHGAADLLLGSDHRAERHDVLHRQPVPAVEGQPVRRRPRHARSGAADARRREDHRRGAVAEGSAAEARSDPRRARRSRRRAVCADRRRCRPTPEARSEEVGQQASDQAIRPTGNSEVESPRPNTSGVGDFPL